MPKGIREKPGDTFASRLVFMIRHNWLLHNMKKDQIVALMDETEDLTEQEHGEFLKELDKYRWRQ